MGSRLEGEAMRILGSKFLIPLAALIFCVLFWFRPGAEIGPRTPAEVPAGKGFDHSAWDRVLKAVVDDMGHVDYAKLKAEPQDLDQYLGFIRAISPATAPHRFRGINDRLAYYLNAYNAFVLAGIRDLCPIESVGQAYLGNGFFWRISFLMGEEEITLSTLESERVRGVMQRNPIVHFALVKGARGFMPLGRSAFTAAQLDEQLEALAQRMVERETMVKRDGDTLLLSELFQWYQHDFVDVEAWLKRHVPKVVDGHKRIAYRPFDWRLNGQCAPN